MTLTNARIEMHRRDCRPHDGEEMTLTNDRIEMLLQRAKPLWWYHNFKLPNGARINGWKTYNSTVVRTLFRGLDLRDRNCVDLGAMDGLYSVLMKQMGAKNVVAFDRKDRTEQIAIVRELSGVDFRYLPEVQLGRVRFHLRRRWNALADFVNFSGILYHMFDVMGGIGTVRGMTRRGGLVLLDTPAIVSSDPIQYFNWNEVFYGPGTYQIPSVFSLEKMCEFMGFEILDAVFTHQSRLLKHPQVRIALILRATDFRVLQPTNQKKFEWVADYMIDDFAELMDIQEIRSADDAATPYTPIDNGFASVSSSDRGRLYEFCSNYPELPFNEEDPYLQL